MNRTLLATVLSTATVLSNAAAQTAAVVPPPMPPVLYTCQYWPTQYIQFLENSSLPYSMVEFDVDSTAKQPLYHCVLTARDGSRTHYSNVDGIIAGSKAAGEASYKTAIAFDSDDTGKPGSTSTMRFTLQDGKPLEWRFVQGSDISAQGGGLTPLPLAPIPMFAYREEGAVAGEGTALKIGDTVSTAEVWKEISKPHTLWAIAVPLLAVHTCLCSPVVRRPGPYPDRLPRRPLAALGSLKASMAVIAP